MKITKNSREMHSLLWRDKKGGRFTMKSDMLNKIGEGFKKIDPVKALSIGGMLLGFAATALSNSANKQEQQKTIEKEVAKALQGKALREIVDKGDQ
jgi:hypothetical protein